MEWWEKNNNSHYKIEDEWLSTMYDKIERVEPYGINHFHKDRYYEKDRSYCCICGDRNTSSYEVKPNILYNMKFPLGTVIPEGITKNDEMCSKCGDWIDFMYKMQNRVDLYKNHIKEDEQKKSDAEIKATESKKQCIILNGMLDKKADLILDLRKEIRKLNYTTTSLHKEELKKELREISDKIKIMKKEFSEYFNDNRSGNVW